MNILTLCWPYFTYIIIVSHVHPTVEHDVFASDRDEDAAAADILSSTLEREEERLKTVWHLS